MQPPLPTQKKIVVRPSEIVVIASATASASPSAQSGDMETHPASGAGAVNGCTTPSPPSIRDQTESDPSEYFYEITPIPANKPPRDCKAGASASPKPRKYPVQKQMFPVGTITSNTETLVVNSMNHVGSLVSENTKAVQAHNSTFRDVFTEIAAFRQEAICRDDRSHSSNKQMAIYHKYLITNFIESCKANSSDAGAASDIKEVTCAPCCILLHTSP